MLSNRRITIHDIAEEAGVSPQTVSRVLNNRPDVAPGTRLRIQELIERLNFQPSAIARSLTRRDSMTLGFVGPRLQHSGFFRTLEGITEEADRAGYGLLFKQLLMLDARHINSALDTLYNNQVDGIIWNIPQIGDKEVWLQHLRLDVGTPCIFLSIEETPGLSTLRIDAFSAGRSAVEHLLEQGYRHIGHVSGPLDWWLARERKRGWAETLAQAGYRVAAHHSAESDWTAAGGRRAIRQLFDSYPAMDAVFAANDHLALAVLSEAHARGVGVPDELGVVGYDNFPEAAEYWPALTSIEQDQPEFGRTAVRELVRMITFVRAENRPPVPASLVMPVKLIKRRSTARA
jgi:LacI family transcriptional regulator